MVGGLSGRPTECMQIADTIHLRDIAMATILAFYIGGVHWRLLANMTEPSMCGGDAALCQITLTTCYLQYRCLPVMPTCAVALTMWFQNGYWKHKDV